MPPMSSRAAALAASPLDALQPARRAYQDHELPIIARGEGCYVWDQHGKPLPRRAVGPVHRAGRPRPAGARGSRRRAGRDARLLPDLDVRAPARRSSSRRGSPSSRPATSTACSSRPAGPRRSSRRGSWPASTSAPSASGQRYKVIARRTAYHGTTMGALAITGVPGVADAVRAAARRAACTSSTPTATATRWARTRPRSWTSCADAIEDAILFEGPETVAAVFLEPVQNAGGCFPPPEGYFQRVREICDRYGVLLVSDEVICAFGRLGEMFGAQRYDYLPDMITTAKGLTSGYSPLGAVICRDFLAEPFLAETRVVHARHHVRRPPGELRGRARATSTCSRTRTSSRTSQRQRGRVRGAADRRRCTTSRSSATSAAPATSGRSSW